MSGDTIISPEDAMRWAQEIINREGTSQSKVSMVSVEPLRSAERELILEATLAREIELKPAERQPICYSRPAVEKDEIIKKKDKD